MLLILPILSSPCPLHNGLAVPRYERFPAKIVSLLSYADTYRILTSDEASSLHFSRRFETASFDLLSRSIHRATVRQLLFFCLLGKWTVRHLTFLGSDLL